jgi:hypothetical protein
MFVTETTDIFEVLISLLVPFKPKHIVKRARPAYNLVHPRLRRLVASKMLAKIKNKRIYEVTAEATRVTLMLCCKRGESLRWGYSEYPKHSERTPFEVYCPQLTP